MNYYWRQLADLWQRLTKSEKATWILAGISLVADLIAIVGALVWGISATRTRTLLSPGFAFSIWILAAFTYLAFLHSYWQQHWKEQGLAPSFSEHIWKDVLVYFRFPWAFGGFLVLILVLLGITSTGSSSLGTSFVVFILVLLALGIFSYRFVRSGDSSSFSGEVSEDFKQKVEDNWEFWVERIELEFSFNRKMWITSADFNDIRTAQGLSHAQLKYVLATYAWKNPRTSRFCNLYSREYSEIVEMAEKYDVLISIENLDHQKFYYK